MDTSVWQRYFSPTIWMTLLLRSQMNPVASPPAHVSGEWSFWSQPTQSIGTAVTATWSGATCHMWHWMTLLTSGSASPSICWRASQSYNWRRTAAKPLAVAWSVSWSLLQMQLCHQLCHRNPPVQLFGPHPKGASSNTRRTRCTSSPTRASSQSRRAGRWMS